MSTRLQIAALVFVMTNAVAFGILTAEMDDHSFAWLYTDGTKPRFSAWQEWRIELKWRV
jgi:hypothetical protein